LSRHERIQAASEARRAVRRDRRAASSREDPDDAEGSDVELTLDAEGSDEELLELERAIRGDV